MNNDLANDELRRCVQLHDLANDELQRCEYLIRNRALPHWKLVPWVSVTVKTTLRGRSTRGLATYATQTINLNPDYYAAVGEAYRQTIAHEYAHLVVYATYASNVPGILRRRVRPHGFEWQSLMRLFGYSATRSSDYGERGAAVKPARKTRRYQYVGINCGHVHVLGPKHHASAQRGVMYRCCTGDCKYKPRDERGIAFDKEVS